MFSRSALFSSSSFFLFFPIPNRREENLYDECVRSLLKKKDDEVSLLGGVDRKSVV